MKNKILGAGVFFLLGLVLISGIASSGARMAETAGETVREFAPIPQATADIAMRYAEQEIQITATYMAELSSQVMSDTMTTHALQRNNERQQHKRDQALAATVTTVKQIGVWGIGFGVVAASVGIGVKFGAMWAADGIKAARKSIMPLPQLSRPLADGFHLLAEGRGFDTRSMASWSVVSDVQPTPEQAEALALIRRAVWGEIAQAFVPLLAGGQKQLMEVTRE